MDVDIPFNAASNQHQKVGISPKMLLFCFFLSQVFVFN